MFCRKCGCEKVSGERCKQCTKLYHKNYRQNNKEKLNETVLLWYHDNKIIVNDRRRSYNNKYERDRKKVDPIFKLRKNCSRLINHALKGLKNGNSILKYLPYTILELRDYLENKFDKYMSWDNYGIYWHIDHIIPQSKLPYTSMEDENFKKCWALENLQPLEAIENMKKGNK